jgi:hypothetical protein
LILTLCKASQGSENACDPDHNPDDQGGQARKHQKVLQGPYHPDPPTLRNWECLGSRGSRGIHGQSKGGSGSLRPRGASCRLKLLGVNRHDGLSLNGGFSPSPFLWVSSPGGQALSRWQPASGQIRQIRRAAAPGRPVTNARPWPFLAETESCSTVAKRSQSSRIFMLLLQ